MLAKRLAQGWRWLCGNPVSHWSVLFVVLAATVEMHDNNVNPYSRYAMLSAMVEDHSFAIDSYRADTCDWSRPPDGHYYSNKAPGAALLAVPVYLPVDALVVAHAKDRPTRDARRLQARNDVLDFLALALQAVPFALLVMVAASMLAARGTSRPALELCALAMLFGNTASLLMNMFYGHGLAAVLTLGMALLLHRQRYAWAGLLLGLNVLTDYGSALFLPVVLLLTVWPGVGAGGRWRRLLRLGLGGLSPLLLFVAYHKLCFGGALTLPNKYQNPVFVEAGQRALWGVIDFLPSRRATYALLVGAERSLWITQPWVLCATGLLPWFLWRKRQLDQPQRALAHTWLPLAFGGLLLLFLMNASFGGWHGGVCPGPRYLSAALPLVGLALGLMYDRFPRLLRWGLWCALLPSLALFAVIWAGDVAVWPQHLIWRRVHETLYKFGLVRSYLRLGWILFGFAITAAVAVTRLRLASRYPTATQPPPR